MGYVGINDKSKKIGKAYVGINNLSKKVKLAYIGDETGKARRVFHEHGNWVVTTISTATCTSTGKKRYTCGYCSYYYNEVIPKIEHLYVGGKCKFCNKIQIGDVESM